VNSTGGIWVAADRALFALLCVPFTPQEREVQPHVRQQAVEPVIGIHAGDRGMVLILPIGIAAAALMHPVPMQPGFWVHVGFVCLLGGI